MNVIRIVLPVLVLVGTASADIINVPADYPTIQAAVNASRQPTASVHEPQVVTWPITSAPIVSALLLW